MPIVKRKGGWKIARSSGGTYPKTYKTKKSAEKRAKQMEVFGALRDSHLLTKH
jgi:hypothetical protein